MCESLSESNLNCPLFEKMKQDFFATADISLFEEYKKEVLKVIDNRIKKIDNRLAELISKKTKTDSEWEEQHNLVELWSELVNFIRPDIFKIGMK